MAKVGRKSVATERRAQILEAFQRCATRNGLEKTSLREVARQAGIPVSNLHHYFENRDEMVCELVRKNVERLVEDLEAELRSVQDPQAKIEKFLGLMFGPKTQKLEIGSLFYDCWSLAHRSETVREVFQAQIRGHRASLTETLRASPEFSGVSKADLREIANILLALLEGTYYLLDMDGAHVSPKRMARLTQRFLLLYAEDHSQRQSGGKGR
jgi:AcrR family transcriptional regulator